VEYVLERDLNLQLAFPGRPRDSIV